MNQVEPNDLQLLALLQHNGLPTRLLDVTANPLTAPWFACMSKPSRDGLLIAFNVSTYPEIMPEQKADVPTVAFPGHAISHQQTASPR